MGSNNRPLGFGDGLLIMRNETGSDLSLYFVEQSLIAAIFLERVNLIPKKSRVGQDMLTKIRSLSTLRVPFKNLRPI